MCQKKSRFAFRSLFQWTYFPMSLCLWHLKETCIPYSVKVPLVIIIWSLVIGHWVFGHENLLIYLSDHHTIASQGAIINRPSLNQLYTVTCVAGVERRGERTQEGKGRVQWGEMERAPSPYLFVLFHNPLFCTYHAGHICTFFLIFGCRND